MRSVVLRGAFVGIRPQVYIQQVIDSIRTWHSEELIISTWTDQVPYANGLIGVDKIVSCDDPGTGPIQDILRQSLSFYNGVNACSGTEVMVTRPDIVYFRDLFELRNFAPKRSNLNFSPFKEKILIGNMMTILPGFAAIDISTFRTCDWFLVGNKDDMLKWSSIYEDIHNLDLDKLLQERGKSNICSESLWFKLVIQKYLDPNFPLYDKLPNDIDLGNYALVDNFEIVNTITTAKCINLNWATQPQRLSCYITEEQYKEIYNKLCE